VAFATRGSAAREETEMVTKKRRLAFTAILALVGTALLVGVLGSPASSAPAAPRATLIVGGIHVGSVKDAGYNEAQHDGLMYLKSHVAGVEVIEASNVPEGPQVETVMQNMIGQGAKLLFPQSFGYQDFALNVAAKNPSVVLEHPAGYKSAPNFGTYWAASSPINYALGAAAAKVSKTGKIGFVGSIPIPTIIATADAFHLGAQSVNPTIKTVVVFTGSWSDPAKEAAAVNTLANQHVDVVAGLVDSPITYVKTAESRHMWAIGYHSKAAQKYAPKYWLSGVDFNWGPMFVQMAQQVMAGEWKAQSWIAPVKMGIAKPAPFGPRVPAAAKLATQKLMKLFVTGKQTSVFKGPVYDQSGKLRVQKGVQPPASFEQNVNWLVKGMIGRTK
jgi:basic membrane lipoprotein Med (substrate-binding protein (PBP1-ABC) superfamily)